MAPQLFAGSCFLFHVRDPGHSRYISLDGGSARRKALPTHGTTQA
jgi:hypothetical protein